MKVDTVILGNCVDFLRNSSKKSLHIDLTFLDPPFNQGKEYRANGDDLPEKEYWKFMKRVSRLIYNRTNPGGSIYFMQREKNTKSVMQTLAESGWNFQNLIIWKKKTSAVPQNHKFGLQYQIIVFAVKGEIPTTFNKLRINPPKLVTERYERPTGMYVTDVWDDIRELTSGYFAGDEAIRDSNGNRMHNQQSPVALLLRIILSSTKINDLVFDPFAGTGTTLVTARQLKRRYIGVELDRENISITNYRLNTLRESDNIDRYYKDYIYTENLDEIWDSNRRKVTEAFRLSVD